MRSDIETAIAKINSVGDRLCQAQVYYFDDYDPDTEDATELCNRLGVPLTDDIIVEFRTRAAFAPISESRIAKFANQLGASLPADYKRLLAEFGAFHLPGRAAICFYSPETALSATRGAWWYHDPSTTPVLAISPYHLKCDGDSIGFVRDGRSFASELYVFKHELRWEGDDPKKWTEQIAGSLSEFIVSYIDSLPLVADS